MRLLTFWDALQDSLGFPAAVMTAAACLLALVTTWIDAQLIASGRVQLGPAFEGGVDGSRELLGIVAGSTITVAGTVFSITIVALQLASTQYTPRVLRQFTRDRGNQYVLGVFVATFTYSLLVLRTVRSEGRDVSAFVPSLSVAVAIGLALLSVGFLIFYFHHAARWLQVAYIIDHSTRDTIEQVRRAFPSRQGTAHGQKSDMVVMEGEPASVPAKNAGYVEGVGVEPILKLADERRLVIRMDPHLGDFVLPGEALASVWPASAVDEQVVEAVCNAFIIGEERTLHQDLEFGLRQLADVGVRALSPSLNDPTTAINCVDRLAEVLVALGNCDLPDRVRADERGRVWFLARETSFDRAVKLAYSQIRHHGAVHPVVSAHLIGILGRIAAQVPPAHHAALAEQIVAALRATRAQLDEPLDLAEVEQAARRALAQVAESVRPSV